MSITAMLEWAKKSVSNASRKAAKSESFESLVKRQQIAKRTGYAGRPEENDEEPPAEVVVPEEDDPCGDERLREERMLEVAVVEVGPALLAREQGLRGRDVVDLVHDAPVHARRGVLAVGVGGLVDGVEVGDQDPRRDEHQDHDRLPVFRVPGEGARRVQGRASAADPAPKM